MNIAEALTNRSRFGLRATRRAHARARPNAPVTYSPHYHYHPSYNCPSGYKGYRYSRSGSPCEYAGTSGTPRNAFPFECSKDSRPDGRPKTIPSEISDHRASHSVFDEDSDRAVTPDLLHTSCISLRTHEKDWQCQAHSASTPTIETLDRAVGHDSYVIKSG